MAKFIVKRKARKEYEQITCRIEVELLEKVKNVVAENDLDSVNSFINKCLKYAINNIKFDDNSNIIENAEDDANEN